MEANTYQQIFDSIVFEDKTQDFEEILKSLSLGEMIQSDSFSLYDSMSATELGDPKMDYKYGLKDIKSINEYIKEGLILPAETLTLNKIIGIYDHVLTLFYSWLAGNPHTTTIYQFLYLYDSKLYENSLELNFLIKSVYFMANNVYDQLRVNPFLREDDYIISIFSFPEIKSISILEELYQQLENKYKDQITPVKKRKQNKNKNLNIYDGLECRVKNLKNLLSLITVLREKYCDLNSKKIDELNTQLEKRVEEMEKTIQFSEEVDYLFSQNISKTLVFQISPRPVKKYDRVQGMEFQKQTIHFLKEVLKFPFYETTQQFLDQIDYIWQLPKNILIKSYLDCNIYDQPMGNFSGQKNIKEMIEWSLNQMGLKPEHFQDKVVADFIGQSSLVFQSIVEKFLKNKYRQHREYKNIYQDLSYILSIISYVDQKTQEKNFIRNVLQIWGYQLAIQVQTRHLQFHFELELLDEADYPFTFFYLEYLLNVNEKNNFMLIQKFDQEFLQSLQTKINFDKKKKKLTNFQRIFFNNYIFQKAQEYYFKACRILTYVYLKLNYIPQRNNDETYRYRYENRFKIFNKVYYLKYINFDSYNKEQEEFLPNLEPQTIKDCSQKIKGYFQEALDQFKLISQQDDIQEESFHLKCTNLKKIIVNSSITNIQFLSKLEKKETFKVLLLNDIDGSHPYLKLQ